MMGYNTQHNFNKVRDRYNGAYSFMYEITNYEFRNNKTIVSKKPKISFSELKGFLTENPYNGQGKCRDLNVENSKLPAFIHSFYELLDNGYIYSAEKFCNYYINRHFIDIGNGQVALKEDRKMILSKDGVIGRAFRAYPSILRDFHFYMMCLASRKFEEVYYSLEQDYSKGVDLMLKYKGVKFSISLLVDTKNSLNFKDRKYIRHNYNGLKEIQVRINPTKEGEQIGNYTLYTKNHVYNMIEEMERIIKPTYLN